ncbi:unnamed protein product, partial [Ectocarpus sp. 8 AP-2014]
MSDTVCGETWLRYFFSTFNTNYQSKRDTLEGLPSPGKTLPYSFDAINHRVPRPWRLRYDPRTGLRQGLHSGLLFLLVACRTTIHSWSTTGNCISLSMNHGHFEPFGRLLSEVISNPSVGFYYTCIRGHVELFVRLLSWTKSP